MSTPEQPQPRTVRLVATYAATDGSIPETIEITWEQTKPDDRLLQELVTRLALLPTHRTHG